MSIFQIPKKNTQQLLNKNKYNKIYVLSRKKCNPFSLPSSNLNNLKLEEIVPNPYQTMRKKLHTLYNPSQRLFKSQHHQQSQSFSLEYQHQQGLNSLLKKRKLIQQKIAQHFKNSVLKSKYDKERNNKLQSFRHSKAINSKSLLANLKKFDKNLNTQQLQMLKQYKKSSLPDLNRLSTLQISSHTTQLRRKNKKRKDKLNLPMAINNQSEFIRTGMINGLKIYNKSPKNIKKESNKSQKQPLQISCQKNHDSIERQYPFVRKAQHNNPNETVNQKVSRKNMLQLRRRRSLQNQVFKTCKFNGQSLIKIQKLASKVQTINFIQK